MYQDGSLLVPTVHVGVVNVLRGDGAQDLVSSSHNIWQSLDGMEPSRELTFKVVEDELDGSIYTPVGCTGTGNRFFKRQ